jgi:hypothetical protein
LLLLLLLLLLFLNGVDDGRPLSGDAASVKSTTWAGEGNTRGAEEKLCKNNNKTLKQQ